MEVHIYIYHIIGKTNTKGETSLAVESIVHSRCQMIFRIVED